MLYYRIVQLSYEIKGLGAQAALRRGRSLSLGDTRKLQVLGKDRAGLGVAKEVEPLLAKALRFVEKLRFPTV